MKIVLQKAPYEHAIFPNKNFYETYGIDRGIPIERTDERLIEYIEKQGGVIMSNKHTTLKVVDTKNSKFCVDNIYGYDVIRYYEEFDWYGATE